MLVELGGDLEAAFDRFLVDPLKTDKLCRAKLAIVQALDQMEHLRRDVFEKAARHVQLEPGWGKEDDTGAPLRGAASFVARIGGSDYHSLLVDSLTDSEKDVRMAAAQGWGTSARKRRGWCFVSRPAWAIPLRTSCPNASRA